MGRMGDISRSTRLVAWLQCFRGGVMAALASFFGKLGGIVSEDSLLGFPGLSHATPGQVRSIEKAVAAACYVLLFVVRGSLMCEVPGRILSPVSISCLTPWETAPGHRLFCFRRARDRPSARSMHLNNCVVALWQCNAAMMSLQLRSVRVLPSLQATVINTLTNLMVTVSPQST